MTAVDSPRRAGILVPLFSMPSSRSWGIGEFGDLEPFAAWLRAAGQSMLQILPLNEASSGQNSPYSALAAMALDPVYITLGDVDEFAAAGGEDALDETAKRTLAAVRASERVDYRAV